MEEGSKLKCLVLVEYSSARLASEATFKSTTERYYFQVRRLPFANVACDREPRLQIQTHSYNGRD